VVAFLRTEQHQKLRRFDSPASPDLQEPALQRKSLNHENVRICGIFDQNGNPSTRDCLERMTAVIKHRGPEVMAGTLTTSRTGDTAG